MEVSDPDSSRYSQWYTHEEVNEMFAPAQEAVDAVRTWLEESGITADRITMSFNKQWVQFDASVTEAEKLLRTKYHNYEHSHSGTVQIACDE